MVKIKSGDGSRLRFDKEWVGIITLEYLLVAVRLGKLSQPRRYNYIEEA